jgi:O-antigen/teichoic acid export membrane protein
LLKVLLENSKLPPVEGFASGQLLAKNSILNLVGMILPLLVGILAIPFAIKGLGKDGFGVLAIAWVVLGYFGLFDFGLSRATTKFVSEAIGRGEVESIPSIVWSAVLVSFLLGILGGLLLFAITPFLIERLLKIPYELAHQAKLTFYIIAFSIPIVLCSTSLKGVLEAAQRFDLENFITIPVSMMSFILPGLSFPFHLSLSMVIFLVVITRFAAALAYLYFSFMVFPIIKSKPAISTVKLKAMAIYGGWISITNIISPILVYMDRFFIGAYLSMASVTFYTAPYEVVTRLRIFPTAIIKTLFPEFSAAAVHRDSNHLEILFVRSFKYILLLVGIIVILFFFTAPVFLQIWLGPEFVKNSLNVFRILSIGMLINSLAIIPFNLLQGIGRPDITAKFHLLESPFYIILLWSLIINFGLSGAALAWSLRVGLDAVLLFWFSIKSYPGIINKFSISHIGRTLLFLFLLFNSILFFDFLFVNIILKLVILSLCCMSFIVLTWYFLLDDADRKIAKSLRIRFIKKV